MSVDRRDIHQGAVFLEVVCKTCVGRLGVTLLRMIHRGYGDDATPLTEQDFKDADKAIKGHEKHKVVIFRGHAR